MRREEVKINIFFRAAAIQLRVLQVHTVPIAQNKRIKIFYSIKLKKSQIEPINHGADLK